MHQACPPGPAARRGLGAQGLSCQLLTRYGDSVLVSIQPIPGLEGRPRERYGDIPLPEPLLLATQRMGIQRLDPNLPRRQLGAVADAPVEHHAGPAALLPERSEPVAEQGAAHRPAAIDDQYTPLPLLAEHLLNQDIVLEQLKRRDLPPEAPSPSVADKHGVDDAQVGIRILRVGIAQIRCPERHGASLLAASCWLRYWFKVTGQKAIWIAGAMTAADRQQQPPAKPIIGLDGFLEALAQSHNQAEAADTLCEAGARLLPQSSATLWLLSLDRERWCHAGGWAEGRAIPAAQGSKRLSLPQASAEELHLPLAAHGLSVGALRVSTEELSGDEQHLLGILSTATAISLSGHLLQRRVRHRNVRDPLTGLLNRRYLEDTLGRELHRARRAGAGLVLLRFEVDDLEPFQQHHGTEVAERLLQSMADLLQRSFRGSDVCCRASEHGFGAALTEAALDSGIVRADAVREELSELRVHHRGRALGPLPISAGVAAFPEHGSHPSLLLEAVEEAVARAQDGGGDITHIAEAAEPQRPS